MRAFAVLLASVLLTGCATTRGPKPPPALPSAGSLQRQVAKGDALVDEELRFALVRPDDGWHVEGREGAKRRNPDAEAVVMHVRHGWTGLVMVEEVGEMSAERYGRYCIDASSLQDVEILSAEPSTVQGREAFVHVARGTKGGIPLHVEWVTLVHQGFGYQLATFITGEDAKQTRRWQGAFVRGFRLLDGTVSSSARPVRATADAAGPGWRISGGVFESAAYGLRVAPPPNFRLLIGEELAAVDADAEFGLQHERPDVTFYVVGQRPPSTDVEGFRTRELERVASGLGFEEEDEPIEVPFAGKAVSVGRYRSAAVPEATFLLGVHCLPERCLRLFASTFGGLTAAHVDAVRQAVAAIEPLPPAEQDALALRLAGEPEARVRVGPDFVYRGGLYRHFTHRVHWQRPDAGWRVRMGNEAPPPFDQTLLFLERPREGLFATLQESDVFGEDAASHHAALAEQVFEDGPRAPARTLRLGELDAWESEGPIEGGQTARVVTALEGERALTFMVWGDPQHLREAAPVVDAARSALTFGVELEPIRMAGSARANHRLGYAFRPPGSGWTVVQSGPLPNVPTGEATAWARHNEAIVLTATPAPEPETREVLRERTFRMIGGRYGMTPEEMNATAREISLGGRPADLVRVRTPKFDGLMVLASHRGVVHVLVVSGDGRSPQHLEALLSGFEYLD